jgi:hypothetical protein
MLFHNLGEEAEEDVLGSEVQRSDRAPPGMPDAWDSKTASLRVA